MKSEQIHATCIAIDSHGVLLRGCSGSGKSDLALRLIDTGGVLVADDRVNLLAESGVLCASAPKTLYGLLEVRGLGILCHPAIEKANISLVCELLNSERIERMPENKHTVILGIELPHLIISPFEASSVIKVQLALKLATGSIMRRYGTD